MRGNTAARITVVAVIALSAALAVTGCSPVIVGPAPGTSQPATTPSPSAEPEPSPSPSVDAEAVPIPTDCTQVVSPESYASTFAKRALNDPRYTSPERSGVLNPTVAPPGSSDWDVKSHATQLYCLWNSPDDAADYSYFLVAIGTLSPAFTDRFLAGPAFEAYTCEEKYEGRVCQYVYDGGEYGSVHGHTVFARDGVIIDITQESFPTHGILGDMVATIWG